MISNNIFGDDDLTNEQWVIKHSKELAEMYKRNKAQMKKEIEKLIEKYNGYIESGLQAIDEIRDDKEKKNRAKLILQNYDSIEIYREFINDLKGLVS